MLEPLRNRSFRRLLASYLVNETGDVVGLVALALVVYAKTGDAVATTGLFLALNVVPALLAPLLTARLDTLPLRRVLPPLYLAEAGVFALLAFVAENFTLSAVLLLGLLDGTLAVTGRGLTRGGVGAVLEPGEQLRRGNALLNVCFAVAGVGGAALGGILTGVFGAPTALLVDSASFLAIAAMLATGPALPAAATGTEPSRSRVREGLAYIRSAATVRLLVAGQSLALVFFTMIVPIEVIYARETLDTTEAGFGLLLSAWSVGMVVGSLVFLVGKSRLGVLAVVSTALIGAAYLGMALVDDLAAACAFSLLGGTGNGVQVVSVYTAVQQATPQALQARVMGVMESLNRGMPAIGFVIGGALTAIFSPPAAFAVAGVGVLCLAAGGGMTALLRERGRGATVDTSSAS